MRRFLARLLPLAALLLLLPAHAAAQEPLAMDVTIDPFAAPVAPLQGTGVTNVTVDAPCVAPGGADPTRPMLDLWVAETPRWATVVLSPASIPAEAAQCQMGRLALRAQLIVAASDQAPAFAPAPIEVRATWRGSSPNVTGMGRVDVAAGYFSILDVQLAEAIKEVKPGEDAGFPLVVTNLGNARTRVVVTVENTTESLVPREVAPFVLQSRQQGEPVISASPTLTVGTRGDAGYNNQVGVVTYRITSHHADRPELAGDETSVSVLVTIKGLNPDAPVPGPGIGLAALGIVAAAIVARRRRG